MIEELNLSELFSNFVNFVARNSRILIMIVLIAVIGVVAFQKLKPAVYETKAICMSGVAEYERQEQIEDLSQRTAIDLVNFLKINIDNEDYQQLSDLLGVDIEIAKSVKDIEAEQLYQQDMDEKFYALNKFEVSLILSNNSSIENVQNGLLYYFNNNNDKCGICKCTEKCNGKGRGCGNGQCKRVTIAVFASGKIIITGGRSIEQLVDSYDFIKGVLDDVEKFKMIEEINK